MKNYKSSNYNFIKDYKDNKKIAYNSKTGAVSMVSQESAEEFMKILSDPDKNANTELYNNMLEEGYIIPEDYDELEELKEVNQMMSTVKNTLRLTILPTETCNFTCPYCFIYTLRNKHMVSETWDALYKLCQNFCEDNKDSEGFLLTLIWYGGEPLIAVERIIAFMKKINKLLLNYPNATLHSNILTNGYLLTHETFQKLCDVNIRRIQVTVDGDADNHDKLRTLPNKKPTFNTIYSNLLEIIQKASKEDVFYIAIRCNFLKSSVPSAMRLIEKFKQDFSHDSRFSLYFRPVYNFDTDRNSDEIAKSDYFSITDGIRMQNKLLYATGQEIKELQSVSNPLPQPIPSWCDSVINNAYIIGYDGSIYICDTLITDRKDSVGILKNDGSIELYEKAKCWRKNIFERSDEIDGGAVEECIKCKLLPVCMGGCTRTRMDNKGKSCFWTEELIYKAMDEYAEMYE